MYCHAGFGVGELARGEVNGGSRACEASAVRVALCISLFVLYILLISIVVVTVHFICCSVKLPLSRPTSFAFFFPFFSPSLRGKGRQSDHMVLCCWPGPNCNTKSSGCMKKSVRLSSAFHLATLLCMFAKGLGRLNLSTFQVYSKI